MIKEHLLGYKDLLRKNFMYLTKEDSVNINFDISRFSVYVNLVEMMTFSIDCIDDIDWDVLEKMVDRIALGST